MVYFLGYIKPHQRALYIIAHTSNKKKKNNNKLLPYYQFYICVMEWKTIIKKVVFNNIIFIRQINTYLV